MKEKMLKIVDNFSEENDQEQENHSAKIKTPSPTMKIRKELLDDCKKKDLKKV